MPHRAPPLPSQPPPLPPLEASSYRPCATSLKTMDPSPLKTTPCRPTLEISHPMAPCLCHQSPSSHPPLEVSSYPSHATSINMFDPPSLKGQTFAEKRPFLDMSHLATPCLCPIRAPPHTPLRGVVWSGEETVVPFIFVP